MINRREELERELAEIEKKEQQDQAQKKEQEELSAMEKEKLFELCKAFWESPQGREAIKRSRR